MKDLFARHRGKVAYLVVGGWNTLFGYGVFALLYHFLSDKTNSVLILTFSYILSITNAFIGYKLFVFRSKGNIVKEYLRFYVVYGGAFLVNIALLPVLVDLLSVNAYLAQATITVLTIIGSYMFHNRFTFRMK